jgi:putative DNA primase/helicase
LSDVAPLTNIQSALEFRPQWVNWKLEKRNGKLTKVPYQPNGPKASSTDVLTWSTYDQVRKAYERSDQFDGIGFVFCSGDPYCGVDLDHCRDAETRVIEPWALEIIQSFERAYIEISPSGTGVHIIAEGKVPGAGNKRGNVEMYSQDRFFTFTGNALEIPR